MHNHNLKIIIARHPRETEIKGTVLRNGVLTHCALYAQPNDRVFYFSNYQEGAFPEKYKSKDFTYSWVTTLESTLHPPGVDLNSFIEATTDVGFGQIHENFAGRWIRCTVDRANNIPWKVGDYKQIKSNDGKHVTLTDHYRTTIGNGNELMPPGFDPQKHEGTGKHISEYTGSMLRGQYRQGSLVTCKGDKLRGALYKSTYKGRDEYYFLHNSTTGQADGSKPNEGIPVKSGYIKSWDIGHSEARTKFDQINPMSFIPTLAVYEMWEEDPKPVVEAWSLVGRYIRTPHGANRQIKTHLSSGLVTFTSGTEGEVNLHHYNNPNIFNHGYELLPTSFEPGRGGHYTSEELPMSSDPLLDYLVVGMGKNIEEPLEPVMFSPVKSKKKNKLADVVAMQLPAILAHKKSK